MSYGTSVTIIAYGSAFVFVIACAAMCLVGEYQYRNNR